MPNYKTLAILGIDFKKGNGNSLILAIFFCSLGRLFDSTNAVFDLLGFSSALLGWLI